jgi:PAS domain S-box-containing protein
MSTASPSTNFDAMPQFEQSLGREKSGHVVQLYSDDAFLLEILTGFIGGALSAGDGALVVATRAHAHSLEQRLRERGLDTGMAIRQGRYIVLDARELLPRFMVNDSVDEGRFTEVIRTALTQIRDAGPQANRRIAVFGELVALLWAEGKMQEAIRVEKLWNKLAEEHRFFLLCAYPVTGFSDEKDIQPFLEICRQHSDVVPNENKLTSTSEEASLRSLAQLQLKAQMLEKELALRRSEQRFQLFVEAVRDYAIFMLDPEGHVATWNRGAERIKGYKASEIIGSHFSRFYPEEDLRAGKPQWELKVAAKEGRFEDEGWRVRKDGSRFWANVIITAVHDETGKLIGFGKVTRDSTERMQAQRALQREVAEKQQAEMRLRESEKSLRDLSLHLLRTQDEERRRIGRDLHDSLGQSLAVLKMKLDSLVSVVGKRTDDEAADDVAQCIRLTEDSIKELRTISYLLYPPMLEEMGLKSAIPWYLDGFSARSGIKTTLEVASDFTRLPRDAELALFRVFQESLTNVHRHSGSPTAEVRLFSKDGMGILEVRDRGKGLPPGLLEQSSQDWMGQLGVGLRGMNERMRQLGGTLELTSTKEGTTVRAMVPAQLTKS